MQNNLLPQKTLTHINSLQRNFFWGSISQKQKLHLLSWDIVTTPKHMGGLGIPKLRPKNISMLTSLNWRFHHTPDSLWAKVLRAKYGRSVTHLSPYYYSLPITTNSSYNWKSMAHTSHICHCGTGWNIASGRSIHLWNDYCIPPNSSQFLPPTTHPRPNT